MISPICEVEQMTPLFKKLNLSQHLSIVVLNAPEEFEAELAALPDVKIHRSVCKTNPVSFGLAFVMSQKEVEDAARMLSQAEGDTLVWMAYPKQSSKKYQCDFNRDTGWGILGELGFEGVRQVAIDDNWSALRFRRVEYIESLKRESKRALTEQGKQRTKK
jgi:hypothetical protein